MATKKYLDLIEIAKDILKENNVSAEVYDTIYKNRPVIAVDISWGDWKHDHAFVDYILTNNGFNHIANELTEEDGSDCYSAVHYYDTTTFRSVDIDSEISAADLCRRLKLILAQCPDAIVTIRHAEGTDFPPFLTIESRVEHDRQDEAGDFENLLK